jgi:hypothetical protein
MLTGVCFRGQCCLQLGHRKLKLDQVVVKNIQFASKIRRLVSRPKKLFVAAGLALVLLVAISGVLVYRHKQQQSTSQKSNVDMLVKIAQFREDNNCNQGLQELSTVDAGKQDEMKKIELLKFRVDCNIDIQKYDDALTSAQALRQAYNEGHSSDREKEQADNTIQLVETMRDNKKHDEEAAKKPKPEKADEGPIL